MIIAEKLYNEEDAKGNIKLKNSLIETFKGIKISEAREYDEKKKQGKSVVDVLQAQTSEMRNAIYELGERLGERLAVASFENEKRIKHLTLIRIVGKRHLPITNYINRTVELGEGLVTALNSSNDFIFGLRPEQNRSGGKKSYIGDTEVDFNNEEIIIKEKLQAKGS